MFFKIELASKLDSESIFNLSNDPLVRSSAFNKKPIIWEDHIVWFSQKLKDKDSTFYVVKTSAGALIAYVRFDYSDFLLNKKENIITIHLHKDFRGKGLGKKILNEVLTLFLNNNDSTKTIIAFIREENIASQKTFSSLGFSLIEKISYNSENFLKFCFIPK